MDGLIDHTHLSLVFSHFLLVSKNIIDLHKGSISVYSAGMVHGCTFSIELPIIVNTINIHDNYNYTSSTDLRISENDSNNNDMNMNESELSPLNGSTIVDSESEHVNAKIKALVVDDSSMNRKMVRRLLEIKGNDADDNEDDNDNNGYYDDDSDVMLMMIIVTDHDCTIVVNT